MKRARTNLITNKHSHASQLSKLFVVATTLILGSSIGSQAVLAHAATNDGVASSSLSSGLESSSSSSLSESTISSGISSSTVEITEESSSSVSSPEVVSSSSISDSSDQAATTKQPKVAYTAKTGYLQDSDGNWYWFENGQKYTGFRFYMGTYYYFVNGVRQNNQWVYQWGNKYYVNNDGRAVQGVNVINGVAYDFGTNGTFNCRGTASGYLRDNNGQYYWFENGQKYTGFRFYMGTYYYFVNGVRQNNQWVYQWGNKYYVNNDGRAVQGANVINGVAYDFGTNGTFNCRGTASGYLRDNNGQYYWFENGQKYTGFRFYMGTYYYFVNGVRQNNQWVYQWGNKYYVNNDGRAVQGHYRIGNVTYDFGTNNTFYCRGTVKSVHGTHNPYAWGDCTYYVWQHTDWVGGYWGNGSEWDNSAKKDGFTVDRNPTKGSVIVFERGQWVGSPTWGWQASPYAGHVGLVQSVSGNTVTITQGGKGWAHPLGPNTQTVVSAKSFSYIHP